MCFIIDRLKTVVLLFVMLSCCFSRADVTVVFNELMYHPDQENESLHEWVELHNQLAVDMDISGWYLDKGVEYRFPEGTVVPGGGYVVVASSPSDLISATGITNVLGPFTGRLANSGERLELRNNNDRLMDCLDYQTDDGWPVAADGAGPSLAKIDEDDTAGNVSNWEASRWVGGTPGGENTPDVSVSVYPEIIRMDSAWLFNTNGFDPGAGWNTLAYDAGWWNSGQGLFDSSAADGRSGDTRAVDTLFNSGLDSSGQVLAQGQSDPHYVLTESAYSAPPPPDISATVMINHSAWLANDSSSSWIGPQSVGTTSIPQGAYHYRTTFDLTGMDADTAELFVRVAADNRMMNLLLNGVDQGFSYAGFSAFSSLLTINNDFVDGINTLDFYTYNDGTSSNPGGFRVEVSGTADEYVPVNTLLNADYDTKYFRKTFVVYGDPSASVLELRTILDDGAVYYLNGAEVLRLNLPAGTISHSSHSVTNVIGAHFSGPYQLSGASLVPGTNVFAVEVHQAASGSGDIVFGAELSLSITNNLPPETPSLAFNEICSGDDDLFWLEIINFGTQSVNASNCVLKCMGSIDIEYIFPSVELSAGERRIITSQDLMFNVEPGDRLVLYPPARNTVMDAVTVRHYPRARWPEASGEWYHPASMTPGTANSVMFNQDIVINEIMYHPRNPQGPDYSSPEQWIELYNRGAGSVDLAGWRLEIDRTPAFRFPAGCIIASGEYLVVAFDANYLQELYPSVAILGNLDKRLPGSGGRIELFDNAGIPLHPDVDPDDSGNSADLVVYGDRSPWPSYADGLGASLELNDPRSDNSRPEVWSSSTDSSKAAWQSYSYTGTAAGETANCPSQWKEYIFGLIAEGELLVDDISVVQDPSGLAVELIQNGSFENGQETWRIIGNHYGSRVIADPDDPGNHVLHLVSTGYTEHMHNHAETTLADGSAVVNGQVYRISFKAKWVAGCNRLLSRLYFNHLPSLVEIDMPRLTGTPGAVNSCYTLDCGPTFSSLSHTPVVPSSSESVTVSVKASDPDGVSSGVLHYSVNSGLWNSVPMSLSSGGDGGVGLNAQVPALNSGSIVQFYVEASDSLGAVSLMPAGGPASRALYEVVDSVSLNNRLRTIRIVMTPDDAAFIHSSTNVMSNNRMGCTLITDEKTAAYDAGVHLQGSERGRNDTSRVGFNVRLPFDRPYRGVLDTITVDRSGGYSAKGGRYDEILVKHIITRVGGLPGMYDDLCRIFAPRSQEDGTGLLILAKYSDEFLDSQYKDGGAGELFKFELVYYPTTTLNGDVEGAKLPQPDSVLGTDVKNLGDDPESYRWTFLKENRTDRNYYDPMVQLAKAFSLNGSELDVRMNELMDVNEWMRALAVISLIGCADIYTYGNSHNAIFYFRPEDGKAMLFLWDMDFAYCRSYSDSIVGTSSANTLKLVNLPANLHAYYGHLYDLAETTGDLEYMTEWAGRYSALLGEDWSAAATFLKNRADYVRSQLPSDVDFEITTNLGKNFDVTESPVTITGNGWINVKSITVNGVDYPLSWNSATEWSLSLPLPEMTNLIELQAYDIHGNLISNAFDSITVMNNGTLAPQPVVINEWMADNNGPGGYPDPADGKFQDWVELFNPNAFPVDLTGYTLTDNLSVPDKWTVPSNTVISAHGFLLVWADDDEDQNGNGLHASFKLDADGEALALYSPEGVLQHAQTFGGQIENVSQGYYPDGDTSAVYGMECWTPLAANRINNPSVPDVLQFSTDADGSVTIQAHTDPSHNYVIEYKNDLTDADWIPLYTNRVISDVSSFTDVAPSAPKRFYRTILLQ